MADTNEINDIHELNAVNEPRDASEPNEPSAPREVSESVEPGKTGLRELCSYTVVLNIQPGNGRDIIEIEGVYTDFRDAVNNLKLARLGAEDGWIAPMDRETRDNYPYRNKIGPISADEQYFGWGYAWFDPIGSEIGESVNRVWIGRARLWCRVDDSAIETYDSDEERELVEGTSDLDFEYFGQPLPGNARYDGESEDLISPGEEAYDDEEDSSEDDDSGQNEPGQNEPAQSEPAESESAEKELAENEGDYEDDDQHVFKKFL
jgi:hypothetical protein